MKELIKKISNAKKEIGKISKDSTNPFFGSQYFDINQLLDSIEEILNKHDLMCLQPIKENKVYSIIFDLESGETIESSIELPALTDPQKLGSAITYYRRYTLQSLLSLQAEDDDANKTIENKKEYPKENNQTPDGEEKKWLDEKDIDRVVKQAKEKDLTAKDMRKYYKISKVNFAKLEGLI